MHSFLRQLQNVKKLANLFIGFGTQRILLWDSKLQLQRCLSTCIFAIVYLKILSCQVAIWLTCVNTVASRQCKPLCDFICRLKTKSNSLRRRSFSSVEREISWCNSTTVVSMATDISRAAAVSRSVTYAFRNCSLDILSGIKVDKFVLLLWTKQPFVDVGLVPHLATSLLLVFALPMTTSGKKKKEGKNTSGVKFWIFVGCFQ